MREKIIKCDRCKKDITKDPFDEQSHIEFNLYYWHGGSIGGSENKDHFELDLCGDCSRELSYMITDWLKSKKSRK